MEIRLTENKQFLKKSRVKAGGKGKEHSKYLQRWLQSSEARKILVSSRTYEN